MHLRLQMSECVDDNRDEGIRWDNNGAIGFSSDLLDEWMVPAVSLIRTRLKVKGYDSVVLSGGGASAFVHRELSRLLPSLNVYLIPVSARCFGVLDYGMPVLAVFLNR